MMQRLHQAPAPSRPAARSRLGVSILLIFGFLVAGCGSSGRTIVPQGGVGTTENASAGEQAWADEVFALTNQIRVDHGLEPLIHDERASAAGYAHAWDMHLRAFFAHMNPDGEGPSDRLTRHGVDWQDARENLARGHATPHEVVQGWMDSPNHRANILYAGWTHVGVAVHAGGTDGPWWSQEFYR